MTNGQKILMKGHIARTDFSWWEKFKVTLARNKLQKQAYPACMLLLTTERSLLQRRRQWRLQSAHAFEWARRSPQIAHSVGDLDLHLIHGSLGPPKSVPTWHLDWVRCFCKAHKRDQHTDRQTDKPTTRLRL